MARWIWLRTVSGPRFLATPDTDDFLGLPDRAQLVVIAYQSGLVKPQPHS
jgi:hypothetical protein